MTPARRTSPPVERELVCPDCGLPPVLGEYPPRCACGWTGGSLAELVLSGKARGRQFVVYPRAEVFR